jgi:hypothetical protein
MRLALLSSMDGGDVGVRGSEIGVLPSLLLADGRARPWSEGLGCSESFETAFLGRNLREKEDEDVEVMVEAGDGRALGAEHLDAMERSVVLGAPGVG